MNTQQLPSQGIWEGEKEGETAKSTKKNVTVMRMNAFGAESIVGKNRVQTM